MSQRNSNAVKLALASAIFSSTTLSLAQAEEVRMALNPWIGYGPWYIAEEQGFFEEQGISNVELISFAQDRDRAAAMASGRIDVASIAAHSIFVLNEIGTPLQIIGLLDRSVGADGIVSDQADSFGDLHGMTVAYEEGSSGDILLNDALRAYDMTMNDIETIPMSPSDAGAGMMAGRVQAAVTYEPYQSAAMRENPDVKIIYSGADNPGLISDVLAVTPEMLESNPELMVSMMRAWDQSVAFYRENPEEGRAIIARGVGSNPETLSAAFDGLAFYSLEENIEELNGPFLETLVDIQEGAFAAGMISTRIDGSTLVDASIVEAAYE